MTCGLSTPIRGEYMEAQAAKVNVAVKPQFTFTSKGGAKVGMFAGGDGKLSAYSEASNTTAFMGQSSLGIMRQALVDLKAKFR